MLPKKSSYTNRMTFLIDAKGILRHVSEKVDVTNHGDDLVEFLLELKGN